MTVFDTCGLLVGALIQFLAIVLREHAIFTLRNLLKDNPENQKVVDSIQPSREWDDDGILRDRPGETRK